MKRAVRIDSVKQFDAVIAILDGKGFRPFNITIGEKNVPCFITDENRYMKLMHGSKILADAGYQVVSFEEFMGEVAPC